jgi:hypothetical protein
VHPRRGLLALLPRHGNVNGDPLAAAAFSDGAIRANAAPEVQAEFAAGRASFGSNVPAAAAKLAL